MSGHSKWAKIKRQKGANDAARGKLFSKLSKEITLAAQEGGGDPEMNFTLRMAIDKAKAANFPSDNIDKAVKKGTGELQGDKIVKVIYEAYGPGNVALLVESQTDNTNRAITEIRQIIEKKFAGKMAPEGSVSWQFDQKGSVILESKIFQESEKYGEDGEYIDTDAEEMLLEVMEAPGVEDVQEIGEEDGVKTFEVTTTKDDFASALKAIKDMKFKIIDSELAFKPNQTVAIDASATESYEKLLEDLDECEEVSNTWDNLSQ